MPSFILKMTNKKRKLLLMVFIIGLFSLALASSLEMNAGETKYFDLSEQAHTIHEITYEITGNSSSLDGLSVEIIGDIVKINTTYWYKPDNFTIIFTISGENYVPDGGGGGRTIPQAICYKDYNCTGWSGCPIGYKNEIRYCQEIINCNITENALKPIEEQDCTPVVPEELIEEPTPEPEPQGPEKNWFQNLKIFQKVLLALFIACVISLLILLVIYIISFRKETHQEFHEKYDSRWEEKNET